MRSDEKIYLETDRLFLRELLPSDETNIFLLNSDPEVMRYLTDGKPYTSSEARNELLGMISLTTLHKGNFGFWAVVCKKKGDFIGWFHFRPNKKDRNNISVIELGYRLKREYWGKGFATEGSLALIQKGFQDLGVLEVYATTMKKNTASQRVMEKVGMSFVSEFFDENFPGTSEKDVRYSLLKTDWEAFRQV